MNQALHKKYLLDILSAIYQEPFLAHNLYFKGGTALYLFYELPRFSTDLDFDLSSQCQEKEKILNQAKKVLTKFGVLRDSIIKKNTILLLLSYQKYERILKVEISTRSEGDEFEIKNIFGVDIKLLTLDTLCAGKLIALLERKKARDLFDTFYILKNDFPFNKNIIETRTGQDMPNFWQSLKGKIEKNFSKKNVLHEVGEMIDPKKKDWVREKLKDEVLSLITV